MHALVFEMCSQIYSIPFSYELELHFAEAIPLLTNHLTHCAAPLSGVLLPGPQMVITTLASTSPTFT